MRLRTWPPLLTYFTYVCMSVTVLRALTIHLFKSEKTTVAPALKG